MIEIKGILSLGDVMSLTCCDDVVDLEIDGKSLHNIFNNHFNQDVEEHFEDWEDEKKSPKYSMRYVILDEEPKKYIPFEDLAAQVVTEMLYSKYVSGCYSEWTCGYGGFDYVTGENGHSIFDELRSHVGKYVHLIL